MIVARESRTIMCDSRAEALVGYEIQITGYRFKDHEKYPYTQNETGKQYDYLIVKNDESEYKKRIFIEVKGDNEKHWDDDLLPKQDMISRNGDYLIPIYEKDIGQVKAKIDEKLEIMKYEKETIKKVSVTHFYHKYSSKDEKKA